MELKTSLCNTKFVKYKLVLTLALTFGIIPSLLLHRFIYGISHESAVYLECRLLSSCSHYYEGLALKFVSLVYLILYSITVLYFPYKIARKESTSLLSLQTIKEMDLKSILIVIFVSLLYLPLIFFLSSSNNPL